MFWTINPLMARYDTVAWNPTLIPISVLIVWLILKKIYDNNGIKNWFLLGVVIGFFMHLHVQFAFVILFICISLFLMRKHSKPDVLRVILFILPIVLSFTPLILFDLRHEFLNLKAVQGFFAHRADNIESSFFAWIPVFENDIQPIAIIRSFLVAFLFYFGIFSMQFFMFTNKKGFLKIFYAASMMLWILFPLVFAKYGQRPSEYYFIFLYLFIYITIVDFFYTIKKIPVLFFLLILLFGFNFKTLQNNLHTDYYSLKYKDQLVRQLAEKMKGKIFNLSYTTALTTDYGFRYLVDYYKLNPTGNWKDPLVQIKIPVDDQCLIKVANMGVIIPKELTY